MVVVICALLSAAAFFFSIGMGEIWWLAWLAPIPVLWLAFGDTKLWQVLVAAWAAYALGATNILQPYGGLLPLSVLVLSLTVPSFLFALSVLGARFVARRLTPIAGVFAFATLWTAFDFLVSFNTGGGSVATPATAEVGMPILIQGASLVGVWGITFLLGLVSAGLALSLRARSAVPAFLAVALFAANAIYGYVRMSEPPSGSTRVALIDTDTMQRAVFSDSASDTYATVDAYADQIRSLSGKGVELVVLPEKLAIAELAWQSDLKAKLANAARAARVTLVAGFDARNGARSYNVSWAFMPDGSGPTIYTKRRLVPGLEARYTIGDGARVMANGTGLEICKDMDFQAMIRADTVATKPRLLAVPAWDFGGDRWSHARDAILRSVENGVPMARAARDGLLTLNDRYGRIVAMRPAGGGFMTLIGTLPLAEAGGDTLYDRIGDAFGWLCVAVGLGLVGAAALTRRRQTEPTN
ncbi:MAG TPA: nitrilase-related carbon-nitrogen hydrolase [Rhizomicrobium sp.]|nr:nitrilase-related carbon-nitrogen hydrolase [Rhizomicrobium sp.]